MPHNRDGDVEGRLSGEGLGEVGGAVGDGRLLVRVCGGGIVEDLWHLASGHIGSIETKGAGGNVNVVPSVPRTVDCPPSPLFVLAPWFLSLSAYLVWGTMVTGLSNLMTAMSLLQSSEL